MHAIYTGAHSMVAVAKKEADVLRSARYDANLVAAIERLVETINTQTPEAKASWRTVVEALVKSGLPEMESRYGLKPTYPTVKRKR